MLTRFIYRKCYYVDGFAQFVSIFTEIVAIAAAVFWFNLFSESPDFGVNFVSALCVISLVAMVVAAFVWLPRMFLIDPSKLSKVPRLAIAVQ